MKNLIFLLLLIVASCKSDETVSPSTDKNVTGLMASAGFFKKWKLVEYESRKKVGYNALIEIKTDKNEKGLYTLSGKSSINFFQAGFGFDVQNKTFMIKEISITEIAGEKDEQAFETDFINRLYRVEKYELSADNQYLTLITSDKTPLKLIFKLNE